MNYLDKAKEIISKYAKYAFCGIFNCPDLYDSDESKETVYEDNKLLILVHYGHSYFEVYGLSDEEFKELRAYYKEII